MAVLAARVLAPVRAAVLDAGLDATVFDVVALAAALFAVDALAAAPALGAELWSGSSFVDFAGVLRIPWLVAVWVVSVDLGPCARNGIMA